MARSNLIIAGVALVSIAGLAFAASASAAEPEPAPPRPPRTPPPRGPGGGSGGRTIGQMAAQVQAHPLFAEWQQADTDCRQIDAEAMPELAIARCGVANTTWNTMMGQLQIPTSQWGAVYAAVS